MARAVPRVLAHVLDDLVCPVCAADLRIDGLSLRCGAGHTFDVARQGYVNFAPGDADPAAGDAVEMVRARERFLAAGWFSSLAAAIAETAAAVAERGLVVDAGAGTGYFLAAVLERSPRAIGLALDVSKFAARRAARASARAAALVCDVWRPLPLKSHAAALVLDVLAPRNGAEFHRVLAPGGMLLVVVPTPRHLEELVVPLGLVTIDERKDERLAQSLSPHFRLERRDELTGQHVLDAPAIETAVLMGPSARHVEPAALRRRIAALGAPRVVTFSFAVSVYRPLSRD